MGSIYLTDLADVLRAHGPPGPIREMDGWKTRGNGAFGGYEDIAGVCVHHDASTGSNDPTGERSARYQCFTDAERPNAALHVAWDGGIWVLAAGATNTQGAGGGWFGLPFDTTGPFIGNGRVIGIEQGNNGVGEPYPTKQQDSTLWLVQTLAEVYGPRYGFGPTDVCAHFEWAPGRKIDPSGPSRWAPNGGQWNMDAFRADVLFGTMTPQEVAQAVWTSTDPAIVSARNAAIRSALGISPDLKVTLPAAVWAQLVPRIPRATDTPTAPTQQAAQNMLAYLLRNVADLYEGVTAPLTTQLSAAANRSFDAIVDVNQDVHAIEAHLGRQDDAISAIPTTPGQGGATRQDVAELLTLQKTTTTLGSPITTASVEENAEPPGLT